MRIIRGGNGARSNRDHESVQEDQEIINTTVFMPPVHLVRERARMDPGSKHSEWHCVQGERASLDRVRANGELID